MSSGSQHQADEFNKVTIENLLAALNDKLAEKDLYGDIYVVGGAALILEYGADRRTGDIDCAIQREPEAIHTAAAEIASEWPELPGDWLNETAAVAHKIPDDPDDAAAVSFKGSHLTVRTASPERLIAMKIHAGREADYKDLEHLFGITGIKNGQEAKALTEYHFPHTTIAADIVKRLDTIIQSVARTEGDTKDMIAADGRVPTGTTVPPGTTIGQPAVRGPHKDTPDRGAGYNAGGVTTSAPSRDGKDRGVKR